MSISLDPNPPTETFHPLTPYFSRIDLHPGLLFTIFAVPSKKGLVAERLGSGLQNCVQRFESAPDLNKKEIP